MRADRWWVSVKFGAVVAGAILATACVSVRGNAAPWDDKPGGMVAIDIYETTHARKVGAHSERVIVSELLHKEGHHYVPVRESTAASWTSERLEPGRYKVRVRARMDADGTRHRMPSSDHAVFDVRDGERVSVEVVLKHPGRPLVVAGVTVVIVGGTLWIVSNAMSSMTFSLAAY